MKRVQISSFNANYFSAYTAAPHSFNLSLLVNFLGDGGNDTVGGSSRGQTNLSNLPGFAEASKRVNLPISSNESAWKIAA